MFVGGWKAQCFFGSGSCAADSAGHGAPSAIQARIFSMSAMGTRSPFGGICSSASVDTRKRRSGLSSGLPGTMLGA